MFYMLMDDTTGEMKSLFSWGNKEIAKDYPVDVGYSLVPLTEDVFTQAQTRFLQVGKLTVKDKTATTYDGMFTETDVLSAKNEAISLKDYLTSTDYYYMRKMETGEAVPSDVVQKRIDARNRIRELGY